MQSSSQIVTTNKPSSSFLKTGCPSCRPTNSVRALKGDQAMMIVIKLIKQRLVTNSNTLLYANEGVRRAGDGANVKVERSRVAGAACKVDRLHLVKPDVNRRLVNEDETSLERVQVASHGLVGTRYRLCA